MHIGEKSAIYARKKYFAQWRKVFLAVEESGASAACVALHFLSKPFEDTFEKADWLKVIDKSKFPHLKRSFNTPLAERRKVLDAIM